MTKALPTSIDDTMRLLGEGKYVADRSLATTLFLSLKLGLPLFVEGEAGALGRGGDLSRAECTATVTCGGAGQPNKLGLVGGVQGRGDAHLAPLPCPPPDERRGLAVLPDTLAPE